MLSENCKLGVIEHIKGEMKEIEEVNDCLETTLAFSDSDETDSDVQLESERLFEKAEAELTGICGAIDEEFIERKQQGDKPESDSSSSWFDTGAEDDRIDRLMLVEAQLQHRTEQKQQADKHAQNLIDMAAVHGHERSNWERERCVLESQNAELLHTIECAQIQEASLRRDLAAQVEKLDVARAALLKAQTALQQYATKDST